MSEPILYEVNLLFERFILLTFVSPERSGICPAISLFCADKFQTR